MLPVKPVQKAIRRDPAPSRLRYRLNRLWLRPNFRRAVNFGLPMLAGLAAAWTISAEFDLRARAMAVVDAVREAIVDRPQFVITEISVPDVSSDLAEQIRVAAFVHLPGRASSSTSMPSAAGWNSSMPWSGCAFVPLPAAFSKSAPWSACRSWSGVRPTDWNFSMPAACALPRSTAACGARICP